jgi:hypothetical protein
MGVEFAQKVCEEPIIVETNFAARGVLTRRSRLGASLGNLGRGSTYLRQ